MNWQHYPSPWTQINPRGVLGPAPTRPDQAHIAGNLLQPTTDFARAFNTMTIGDPAAANWYIDSGATAHLASTSGILDSVLKHSTGNSVVVGNGSSIPITHTGSTSLSSPSRSLSLNNVLVAPNIIKNLISVRRFTNDNWCSIEFDHFGFSIKDLNTRKTLLRSESKGDIYSIPCSQNKPTNSPSVLSLPILLCGTKDLATSIIILCVL
ncbi:PREDICTED: uncharacterized protein LOC106337855 [Brassica oleracea var. oleracea]|uniref:uncharacterized protein LOC106337855 n=1 Tax=Brassica oleracea var. oleracea TaxID=109376 RepID=UPI0006A6CEF1|nr:PREDICTED: uncharacterized protein LOC106337855 [Brassica oleracea var. oleracea]